MKKRLIVVCFLIDFVTRHDIEELRGSHWEDLYKSVILQLCSKYWKRSSSFFSEVTCSLSINEHLEGYFSRILTKSLFHLHCETAISITPNFEGRLSLVASDTWTCPFEFILCVAAAACFTLSASKRVQHNPGPV